MKAALCATGLLVCVPAAYAIDEVVVTGTRLARDPITSPSPLTVIGARELQQGGLVSPGDVIKFLPANSGSEFNVDPFTQNVSAGTSNFNLRGLGLNATLVLLNGRRQTVSGGIADDGSTFVDLNALVPLIALERVEVLKDGAAAIYGTDAIAGVANFITRRNFEGLAATIDYANTARSGQDDVTGSFLAGRYNERWSGLAAVSYLRRSWLPSPERDFTLGKANSSFGQPGAFVLLERSPAFPDLPFGTAANASIIDPACAAGGGKPNPRNPQPAGVTSALVGTCTFDFAPYYHLVPRERRWNAFATSLLDLDDVTLSTELAYARNATLRGTSPSFPLLTQPTIPASNPGNVFGVPVLFLGRPLGASYGGTLASHTSETWRGVVAAKGSLADWMWDAAIGHSRNDFLFGIENTLADRFRAALAGQGGPNNNQFFNPFGSSATARPGQATYNDPAVIDDFTEFSLSDYRARLTTVDLSAAHEFERFDLALGGQYRKEKFSADFDDQYNRENYLFNVGGPDFAGGRDIWAGFAEASVPLGPTADLQLALRHESYGDGVNSTDPKIAGSWRPNDWLNLRGSFGTSFRAPSTFQVFAVQTVLEDILDPATGLRGFRGVRTLGRNDLRPEQADVFNLGATLNPIEAVSVSADYWRFDYTDIIVKQGAQQIVDANPNDARIVRTAGQIVRVDTSYINASSALTDGLDLAATWARDAWAVSAAATWIHKFTIQDTPTSAPREVAGSRNFRTFARSLPKWRWSLTGSWSQGSHLASAAVRGVGRYRDDQNADRVIRPHVTLDGEYGYRLTAQTTLAIGAINVFDREPPALNTNAGFDSKIHDPRGCVLYARLRFSTGD